MTFVRLCPGVHGAAIAEPGRQGDAPLAVWPSRRCLATSRAQGLGASRALVDLSLAIGDKGIFCCDFIGLSERLQDQHLNAQVPSLCEVPVTPLIGAISTRYSEATVVQAACVAN